MQCEMHQNARQNAPKRKAKCTKTQGKMHQNARQNAAKHKANVIICSAKKGLIPSRRTKIACKKGQNEALTTTVLVLNAEKSDDKFCGWTTI